MVDGAVGVSVQDCPDGDGVRADFHAVDGGQQNGSVAVAGGGRVSAAGSGRGMVGGGGGSSKPK